MYVAIASKNEVLEIASSKSSSLEGMKVYSKLGYKKLTRFITDANSFSRYSHGESLTVDVVGGDDGRNLKLIVAPIPTAKP